ncbi:MAG: acyl-CoA dehydrogenase C-terminal domain-containing protein [Acetobacteraceae bacterium]
MVGRKLPANMGRSLRAFFHPVAAFIADNKDDAHLAPLVKGLERAFGALQLATASCPRRPGLRDPEEAGAAAVDYLRLFGLVALGFLWARLGAGGAALSCRPLRRRRRSTGRS